MSKTEKFFKEYKNPVLIEKSYSWLHSNSSSSKESPLIAFKQMVVPFLLSGFGNLGAGVILHYVQNWPVFIEIPHLIVLVPSILGVKGNVEMTLCSRLSTLANKKQLHDKIRRKSIITGNMALVQFQASLIGIIAPLVVFIFEFLFTYFKKSLVSGIQEETKNLTWNKAFIILGSCLITTNMANIFLGSLLCLLIVLCKVRFNINPDNIATPIAASAGDLITMGLMAIFSSFIFDSFKKSMYFLSIFISSLLLLLTPCWGFIAWKNEHTNTAFFTGLIPIIIAMIIQNVSGAVMERSIARYSTLSAFQPVINGFGGDLVAVQCSRLSTNLHKTTALRKLPESEPNICVTPWYAFFDANQMSRFALLLVFIAAPSQIPFVFIILLSQETTQVTLLLFLMYTIACTLQVSIALYLAYCFIQFLWKIGSDPDNFAIPIMTAVADFLGSVFLLIAFISLAHFNDPNTLKSVNATIY
ncbi:solute carrier family 41 member 1-like isoform X1 [Dinothrombium tinctorium]|uniref:Solute carrier family 41 member 1-like isoform X1 n=1 Tax=Dinothrombium tinctorium TaxID=1965070 RepID=A0A3S3P7P3_9ACAR|nr:solute carrier family 41 member 1-like isoform X1 [Dinothrombium tinctorium]